MALSAPSFASRDDAATSTGRRDLRPLRYLLRYVGRYRRQLALAAVALVVELATQAVLAVVGSHRDLA